MCFHPEIARSCVWAGIKFKSVLRICFHCFRELKAIRHSLLPMYNRPGKPAAQGDLQGDRVIGSDLC